MPPYQYGNPANDFYLRQAQQLSQQYPYQQNHQQYQPNFQQPLNFPAQQQQRPSIVASAVTNIEEAKATRIEPMTAYVFLDTSNGKIYLKQFAADGTSSFITFSQEQVAMEDTKENPVEKGMTALDKRLANIELMIGEMRNAKSVPDVQPGNAESVGVHAAADVTENAVAESTEVPKHNGYGKWKK